jgi:hypothetical protein
MTAGLRREQADEENETSTVGPQILEGKVVSAAMQGSVNVRPAGQFEAQLRQIRVPKPFELRRSAGCAIVFRMQASQKGRKYLGGKGNFAARA